MRFTNDFIAQVVDEEVDKRHFRLVNAAVTAGHIQQAEIQNDGLIIANIGQFKAAYGALGQIDLNILLFKDFA